MQQRNIISFLIDYSLNSRKQQRLNKKSIVMKPLESNQRVLAWLCGYPLDKTASKRMKIAYIVFALSVIMAHLLSAMASTVFIHRNKSTDLEATLFSLFHTFASSSMLYQSIATVLLRRDLNAIFDGLANIYGKSKWKIIIWQIIH